MSRSPYIPTTQAEAIAQIPTTENKNIVGVPSTANDTGISQVVGAGIGGAVVVTAIFKLLEKFGANLIDGQKSKLSLELRAKELELEAEKAERLAARKEEESKGELIKTTLNTALTNVYQGARESREVYYELLKDIQNNNTIHQKGFIEIGDRLNEQDKRMDTIEQTLKDILNVLRMSDRANK